MKVHDSGMPEKAYWESLFEIDAVLDGLGVDRSVHDAVEMGCGYGTFTLPIADRISGTLHTFDIDEAMIAETRARAGQRGNIRLYHRDVIADGFGNLEGVDAVFLFNILHAEDPTGLLRAGAELLRPGGRVLVIHWRSDIPTPRGPDLAIRPTPLQVVGWARATKLLEPKSGARLLGPWHFGLELELDPGPGRLASGPLPA